MSKRSTLAGTMILCALAFAFPPWGESGSFRTFAFLLSRDVSDPNDQWSSFAILWPILAIEVAVILLVGGTCYLLFKGVDPDVVPARWNEGANLSGQRQADTLPIPTAAVSKATEASSAEPPPKSDGESNQIAGHAARFGAALIDGLIVIACAIAIGFALDELADLADYVLLPVGHFVAHYVVPVTLQAAYYTLTQSSRHMASIGKRARGLIVVGQDGERIGHWRGLFRFVVLYVTGLFTLPLACVLMNRRHLGIHDYAAGTIVLKKSTYDRAKWDIASKGAQDGGSRQATLQPRSEGGAAMSWKAKKIQTVFLVVSAFAFIAVATLSIPSATRWYRDLTETPSSSETHTEKNSSADAAESPADLLREWSPEIADCKSGPKLREERRRRREINDEEYSRTGQITFDFADFGGQLACEDIAARIQRGELPTRLVLPPLELSGAPLSQGLMPKPKRPPELTTEQRHRYEQKLQEAMVEARASESAGVEAATTKGARTSKESKEAETAPRPVRKSKAIAEGIDPSAPKAEVDASPTSASIRLDPAQGPEIVEVAALRAPVLADKSPRDWFTIVATAAADDGTRKDVPVKGGWGYTMDDAIVIDKDDPTVPKEVPFNGVGLEYELVKARIGIEMTYSDHFDADEIDDDFSIKHNQLKQRTYSQDGKQYDVLTFEVTARGREKAIHYTTDYYFEITSFYGAGQPIFGRRFERGSAASLPATPTGGTNSPGTRESGGSAWRINCGKAKTVAERAICSDAALIAFDGYLSEAYASARSVVSATVFDEVRDSQRQWIRDRDTKCGGDVPCLMRATHSRTAALNAFAQRYRDNHAEAHAPAPVSREAESGTSSGGRLTPEEIYRLASQSIVVVLAFDKSRDAISQGSGVVIAANTVATNCHVLKGSVESVVLYAGKAYQTKSIEGSEAFDYCIIRTQGLPASVVALAPISSVSPGQRVYSVGNPQGLDLTIAEGLVSGLLPQNDLPLPLIQTSAAISHGSSGGGLFDEQGRVIGITVGTLKDSQNLNFALPVALSSYVIGQRFGDP